MRKYSEGSISIVAEMLESVASELEARAQTLRRHSKIMQDDRNFDGAGCAINVLAYLSSGTNIDRIHNAIVRIIETEK